MVIGKRLKNPLFCAVIISSVLAYGGIVPVKNRHAFASLIPTDDIVSMYGTVVSNPVNRKNGDRIRLNLRQTSSYRRAA